MVVRLKMKTEDLINHRKLALAKAIKVFGSTKSLDDWLITPRGVFNGKTPNELLENEEGIRLVEIILGRIEYGVYS